MPKQTAEQIIENTFQTLETAKYGLDDYLGNNPKRRISGIRNFIVFARAVTNSLQKLRGINKEKFNNWYTPWQEIMKSNDEMKIIYKLRSEILKEGIVKSATSTYIEHFNSNDLSDILQSPPPHAKSFFIGDQYGGSGWEVQTEDGSLEKYYVELPEEIKIKSSIELIDLNEDFNEVRTTALILKD